MIDIGSYKKNEIDRYLFRYSSRDKIATADHITIPPPGTNGTGTVRRVVTLENIQNEQEAHEKLKEAVDKL
jgi:hypothetical protein